MDFIYVVNVFFSLFKSDGVSVMCLLESSLEFVMGVKGMVDIYLG